MEVTIYGDIIFFINFFMDFLILWVTAVFAKKKISKARIILGSLFLSLLYCGGIVFPFLSFFCYGIGGMVLLALGIWIVFFPKNIKEALQYFLTANVTAFALGGTAMALFFCNRYAAYAGQWHGFSAGTFSFENIAQCLLFFLHTHKNGKKLDRSKCDKRKKLLQCCD